jgi:Transglutaminase-like superfamily
MAGKRMCPTCGPARFTPRFVLLAACAVLTQSARANDHVNGDWFIVSDKAKLTTSIAKHPLLADSENWVKDGAEVRVLAMPSDSAWLVRLTNGAWWGINLPEPLWDKNVALSKGKHEIEAVALMAQGGWAMLYGHGQLATDGVPPVIRTQLQNAIDDLKAAGKGPPRYLAFAPDGGWVLLGENDYREHGLPPLLSQRLAEHRKRGIDVRCVAFDSRGDWFLMDARDGISASAPKHPAVAKIKALQAAGEKVSLIVFTPGVYTHGYVLEHRPVRRVEVTLSIKYTCGEGKVDRWAVFPPAFPEMPRQRSVKRTFEPPATALEESGPLKQKVHIIRVAGKPKGFEARAHCEMTLCTNRMTPLLAGQARPNVQLAPADAKIFTHVTADMTTKVFEDFVAKHKLLRGPQESVLDFARRTFLLISREFKYLYPCVDGKDVIAVGKGDCGGLSWVFVRVMRTSHIPARLILGHWADSETPDKNKNRPPDDHAHAKAEFFAPGLGWVDADLSGGVGAFAQGNPLVCFGNESGDFVVCDFDIDRLVSVWPNDPPTKLGGTQGFFWWYQGDAKGIRTQDHWQVKTLDPHPPRPDTSTRRTPRASTRPATDPRTQVPQTNRRLRSAALPLGRSQPRWRADPIHRASGGTALQAPRAGGRRRLAEGGQISWQASRFRHGAPSRC